VTRDTSIKKVMVFLVVSIVAGILLFVVINSLFFSKIKLTIEGPHNPTLTTVSVGETVLFPTGASGRDYVYSGRTGEYEVVVRGPFTKQTSLTIDLGSKDIEDIVVLEELTKEDIVKQSIDLGSQAKVLSIESFGDNKDWMAVKLNTNKDILNDSTFYMLKYVSEWKIVDQGRKLTPFEEIYTDAPNELVSYLLEEAGD